MSPFIILLICFPSYILSLNIFLSRGYDALEGGSTESTGSAPGGWLARLGWGLGEASVQVLETSPIETYDARIAFFGHSIPEDGLTGWLIPLDSIVGPCPSSSSNLTSSHNAPTVAASTPSPPPSSIALDGVYFYGDYAETEEENEVENIENTGCPPLCPLFDISNTLGDPWQPFPNTTWVALVRRGTCSFADKALYAQSLGASSLIVGSLDESLISMSASGNTGGIIEIPSIFVGAKSYSNLTRLVENSSVSIGIEDGTLIIAKDQREEDISSFGRLVPTILIRLEGEPPWEWYTPIFSLLLVLSLPSLLTLCTLLIHRLRAERREREMRAPEDIVKGLPIRVWTGRAWEKDLERGRRNDSEDAEESDTTPLLRIREPTSENELSTQGYGSTLNAEPSTSAPRGPRLTVPALREQSNFDLDDEEVIPEEEDQGTIRRSPVPLPSSPTLPLSVPIPQHSHEDPIESEEAIPRPPWFTSQSECAICLSDFEIGDRVRVLPCGHVFHLEEVDPWLIKQRRVCPVCKYDVTSPPTTRVPASTSPPDLLSLAAMTATDAANLNSDATSDIATAQQSLHFATPRSSSFDRSVSNPQSSHSTITPLSGAEFTLARGTTASQLLNDVEGRTREEDSQLGFMGKWFASKRSNEAVEEEGR